MGGIVAGIAGESAATGEAVVTDTLRMLLTVLCGFFWTLTYVLAIRTGVRDRTYAVPIVALAMNICWEFQFVFVRSTAHTAAATGTAQAEILIGAVWFVVDCGLLYTVLRFGPREFPYLTHGRFIAAFIAVLALAYAGLDIAARQYDDGKAVLTSYGMNVAMSGLFLAMLAARRSSRGQSLGIAAAKLVGTAAACAGWYLDPSTHPGPWLPFCSIACLLLDLAYLLALSAVIRAERGPAARTRQAPLPGTAVTAPPEGTDVT
ncbi:hypothetical protein [Streptomyces sp. RFCAC02]|uniref:transmembrane-type terpene cyclase n=1 Tax=Streptomyces sp. RFCAC02 TaxID=2499143 RepID=UPI00101EABFC|nr:hypothetical protein [Streptomyces sp. RFCAC02]